jgi:phosphatidate phosphatase PAH1
VQSLTYSSGALLFGGVNALTPHWAGAVDIVAVRQQDGTLKSSPFYVRFGKYQSLYRWRNRAVVVEVNGHAMPFTMKLGSYGNAYFVREAVDLDSGTPLYWTGLMNHTPASRAQLQTTQPYLRSLILSNCARQFDSVR